MRIISIITNELVVEKQKLEHELERVLNINSITTAKKIELTLELINKLSEVANTLVTWESYINKEKQQDNGDIN